MMDFEKVLGIIIREFDEKEVHYGLIGGFALGIFGLHRATIDLDFLIDKNDIEKVEKIMKAIGYKCIYKSEDVSQYISDIKILGEIDFLHAFREKAKKMLERVKEKDIFEGRFKIKILIPEDIIGLKLQAISNNPGREAKEYLDIENLMAHFGKELDWSIIEEYFYLFGKDKKFKELKLKYEK